MDQKTPKQFHRFWLRETARFIAGNIQDGSLVECGVKQGSSSVILAQEFRKNKIILCDTWTGFPSYSPTDAPTPSRKKRLEKRVGHGSNTFKQCRKILKRNKIVDRCSMIRGDICETVPEFMKEHDDLQLCFMHVDTDLYEPAKTSLMHFGPRIFDKGAIFVHDWKDPHWFVHVAVNEFLEKYGEDWRLFVFDPDQLHACVLLRGDDNYLKEFEDHISSKAYE
tara:strand:- start:754 stop:1422 length:669 start_codon:yes stop_codon:yes gene_type:complete